MTTATELRAEALRLRAFAGTVSDPAVLTELRLMIEELERRSRALGNGGIPAEAVPGPPPARWRVIARLGGV